MNRHLLSAGGFIPDWVERQTERMVAEGWPDAEILEFRREHTEETDDE